MRERLSGLELSATTADAAAAEFMRYQGLIACLVPRLDALGAELGLQFSWRDAWRPRVKCVQTDLQWERVGALFSAAAAYSYSAALAQTRGVAQGGLKEAARLFQLAAGCLELAHDLTKAAIWGLSPRWEPSSLSLDVRLEMLLLMRDLMLAQAQRVFYEKACAEGLRESIRAKIIACAAKMFSGVHSKLTSSPELADHVSTESSMFKSSNRSWLGRIEASAHWAAALAEEHMAGEHKTAFEYGHQVCRLNKALASASAAINAGEASGVPRGVMMAIAEGVTRMQASAKVATHENSTIYQEEVPPVAALFPIEAKLVVKPTAPEDTVSRSFGRSDGSDDADPFVGMLPNRTIHALNAHHEKIYELLQELSGIITKEATATAQRLLQLDLPHALDACESDKHMPERLKNEVVSAKALGGTATLWALRAECVEIENKARVLASTANALLDAELESDRNLTKSYPSANLSDMHSTMNLATCRSTVESCQRKLCTATEVTQAMTSRLEASADEIGLIDADIDELEANMPHRAGTPLEEEPCVPALRGLLEELEQLKVDSADTLGTARQLADTRKRDPMLGEAVLHASVLAGVTLARTAPPGSAPVSALICEDAAVQRLAAEFAPFEQMQASLLALGAKRSQLLSELDVQHVKFSAAMGAATSFEARQGYFKKLSKGATELSELHAAFVEGKMFYETVKNQLHLVAQQAAAIADQREKERDQLIYTPKARMNASAAVEEPIPPSFCGAAQLQAAAAYPMHSLSRTGTGTGTGTGTTAAPGCPYPTASGSTSGYPSRGSGGGGATNFSSSTTPAASVSPCGSTFANYAPVAPAAPTVAVATPFPGVVSAAGVAQAVAVPYPGTRGGLQRHGQPDKVPPVVARPAVSAPPNAPPKKIGCFRCRQQFGVPSGTSIVACPFCQQHNRVPG